MNASDIDLLIEHAVNAADLAENRNVVRLQKQARMPVALSAAVGVVAEKPAGARWTTEEDNYLRKNLGWITESEMAIALGRTRVAVRLRWKRDLGLTAPSRNPEYLTAHQAAALLGLDGHKITHWCDVGLIPYRLMAGGRKIRLIRRLSLYVWAVTPANWIYFDWHSIPDDHLRRLCELRQQRWGDEWWSARQVADHHGVETKDVQRLIYRGDLPAVQVAVSKGGRHKDPRWLNWYVRRSDALDAVFVKGRGGLSAIRFTPRAEAWMLKAHVGGWTWDAIARSMGGKCHSHTIRSHILKKKA